MSIELWDWWENRLTHVQRSELMSLSHGPLPVELAREVRESGRGLGLLESHIDAIAATTEWRLTDVAARFVGDRQYDLTHDETRNGARRPDPVNVFHVAPARPRLVELLYTPDCPEWEATAIRLSIALQVTGREDVEVHIRRITTPEQADEVGFTGSPMVRFDGADPFEEPGLSVGLTCRLYRSESDVIGGPTIPMLVDALGQLFGDPTGRA